MPWRIEYYGATVEQRVLSLPPGLLARYLRLADLCRDLLTARKRQGEVIRREAP